MPNELLCVDYICNTKEDIDGKGQEASPLGARVQYHVNYDET